MAAKGWRDMDEIPQGNGEKAARPGDLVNVAQFKSGKWVPIRLLPGVMTQAQYWVNTKKKDGNKARFPVPVPGFDSHAGSQDSEAYDPWRTAGEKLNVYADDPSKSNVVVQFSKSFWMNAIIRPEQENEPAKSPKLTKQERETGFKDKDSDSWTPVQVVRLPKSFIDRVNGLKTMNVKRNKKTGTTESYSMSHAKYGCDILVKYNADASPASQWEVQKGDRTPLTEEEQAYLIWDLDLLANPVVTEEETKREFKSWCTRNKIKLDGDESDDEDDEDTPKKSKKSKKAVDDDDDEFDDPKPKKKSKKSRDEDEDEDDDFDEDPKPKKSKKSRDEDDEDDEDEDDPKPSKKSKKSKPVDDEDDDDFDDEDDPKPAKKKKSKPVDEDDFDEDEEDDPKPKKKSKKSRDEDDEDDEDEDDPKPKKKSKKPVDDEDDEDDEDDAPKSKKSKVKSKKRKDDDDDDGWDDDDD
jgi:hypothetical protein